MTEQATTFETIDTLELDAVHGGIVPGDGGCIPFPFPMPFPMPGGEPSIGDSSSPW